MVLPLLLLHLAATVPAAGPCFLMREVTVIDGTGAPGRTASVRVCAAAGILGVWVNGVQVYDGGKATGAFPGRVLRRQEGR